MFVVRKERHGVRRMEGTIVLHADDFQGVAVREIPDADASHPHARDAMAGVEESNVTPRIQARGAVIPSLSSLQYTPYSNILVTVKFSAGRGKVTYISVHTQNKNVSNTYNH